MKKLNYKIILSLIVVLFITIFFFINFKFSKEKHIDQNQNLEIKEENFTNSNIIKNIEYSSKDLKGNEYIILSEEGEIDLKNNDIIFLKNVTAYQTDAGMCGNYDSVIGMNKDNSLKRFMKKDSVKHFPAKGEASLSGVIVDCNVETGLATKVRSYIFGGHLKNIN